MLNPTSGRMDSRHPFTTSGRMDNRHSPYTTYGRMDTRHPLTLPMNEWTTDTPSKTPWANRLKTPSLKPYLWTDRKHTEETHSPSKKWGGWSVGKWKNLRQIWNIGWVVGGHQKKSAKIIEIGWVGRFGVLADFFSVRSAIFSWPPLM